METATKLDSSCWLANAGGAFFWGLERAGFCIASLWGYSRGEAYLEVEMGMGRRCG